MGRLLSISEVAERLGVTAATIRRWEAEGRIVAQRTAGGQRRYLEEDVDLLTSGSHSSAAGLESSGVSSTPMLETADESLGDLGPERSRETPEPPPWKRRVHEARANLEVQRLEHEQETFTQQELDEVEAREEYRRSAALRARRAQEEREKRRSFQEQESRRIEELREYARMYIATRRAPQEIKAEITREILAQVTPDEFPDCLGAYEANVLLQQKVERSFSRWREEEEERRRSEAKRRDAEAQKRKYGQLLEEARGQLRFKTVGWHAADVRDAIRDLEDLFDEEFRSDWVRTDAVELADEVLCDWDEDD